MYKCYKIFCDLIKTAVTTDVFTIVICCTLMGVVDSYEHKWPYINTIVTVSDSCSSRNWRSKVQVTLHLSVTLPTNTSPISLLRSWMSVNRTGHRFRCKTGITNYRHSMLNISIINPETNKRHNNWSVNAWLTGVIDTGKSGTRNVTLS